MSTGVSLLEVGALVELCELAISALPEGALAYGLSGLASGPVRARGGHPIAVEGPFDRAATCPSWKSDADLVVLMTGQVLSRSDGDQVARICRRCRRSGVPMVVTGAAVDVVARLGLITCVATHWSRIAALRESVGDVELADGLFVASGGITTCAGGAALIDLLVEELQSRFGGALASEVANMAVLAAPRSGMQRQPGRSADRRRGAPPTLRRAIEFMEANFQSPITAKEIAAAAGVSTRQLERLFSAYFDRSPVQYLRRIRLETALTLLDSTRLPVLEVALACGFSSSTTFSKQFREHFGYSPAMFRRART